MFLKTIKNIHAAHFTIVSEARPQQELARLAYRATMEQQLTDGKSETIAHENFKFVEKPHAKRSFR